MSAIVVGFSGRIASGKSSLSTIIASKLQVPHVGFGDYVRHLASYMGFDPSDRAMLQELGALLAKHPPQFCRGVLDQVKYQSGQPLVVDGIRHQEILEELRAQVAPAKLLLIHVQVTDATLDYRRSKEHGYQQSTSHVELHSTESQVTTILPAIADLIVNNEAEQEPEETVNEMLWWLAERGMQHVSPGS